MPFPPHDHTEKAFDFFQASYTNDCNFSRASLQHNTKYSNKTMRRYLRHKWRWFLEQQPDGTYRVLPLFSYVTKSEFLAGHSQDWNGENILLKKKLLEQGTVPRIRITTEQMVLILGIVFLVRLRLYF
jgi:hypothetical protein